MCGTAFILGITPMKIDGYRFGTVTIGGATHTCDVIVFHDRVVPGWRRAEGHSLSPEDLGEILAASPSTLVLGRGAVGMLRVPGETEKFLAGRGVRLIALRTGAAIEEYNRRADDPRVAGAFHLTC